MNKSDIKNAGLKITLPRVKILTKPESSDKRHWSAEELYQELISDGEIIA